MPGGKVFYWMENSLTPHSAVDRGYISGKRSDEVKKKVLLEYGKVIKERLLKNKPYSIVYESNGRKKRHIFNIAVKRTNKNVSIFTLKNINANDIIDKPTLKLSMDTTLENSGLRIKSERSLKMNFKEVPIEERYKFPKE